MVGQITTIKTTKIFELSTLERHLLKIPYPTGLLSLEDYKRPRLFSQAGLIIGLTYGPLV